MQQLDPAAVGPVQHSLLRGVLIGQGRGGGRSRRRIGGVAGAGPSSAQQLQAAVLAGLLGGQGQVEQVRQGRDVIQVAEGGAGAPGAVRSAEALLHILPAAAADAIVLG